LPRSMGMEATFRGGCSGLLPDIVQKVVQRALSQQLDHSAQRQTLDSTKTKAGSACHTDGNLLLKNVCESVQVFDVDHRLVDTVLGASRPHRALSHKIKRWYEAHRKSLVRKRDTLLSSQCKRQRSSRSSLSLSLPQKTSAKNAVADSSVVDDVIRKEHQNVYVSVSVLLITTDSMPMEVLRQANARALGSVNKGTVKPYGTDFHRDDIGDIPLFVHSRNFTMRGNRSKDDGWGRVIEDCASALGCSQIVSLNPVCAVSAASSGIEEGGKAIDLEEETACGDGLSSSPMQYVGEYFKFYTLQECTTINRVAYAIVREQIQFETLNNLLDRKGVHMSQGCSLTNVSRAGRKTQIDISKMFPTVWDARDRHPDQPCTCSEFVTATNTDSKGGNAALDAASASHPSAAADARRAADSLQRNITIMSRSSYFHRSFVNQLSQVVIPMDLVRSGTTRTVRAPAPLHSNVNNNPSAASATTTTERKDARDDGVPKFGENKKQFLSSAYNDDMISNSFAWKVWCRVDSRIDQHIRKSVNMGRKEHETTSPFRIPEVVHPLDGKVEDPDSDCVAIGPCTYARITSLPGFKSELRKRLMREFKRTSWVHKTLKQNDQEDLVPWKCFHCMLKGGHYSSKNHHDSASEQEQEKMSMENDGLDDVVMTNKSTEQTRWFVITYKNEDLFKMVLDDATSRRIAKRSELGRVLLNNCNGEEEEDKKKENSIVINITDNILRGPIHVAYARYVLRFLGVNTSQEDHTRTFYDRMQLASMMFAVTDREVQAMQNVADYLLIN